MRRRVRPADVRASNYAFILGEEHARVARETVVDAHGAKAETSFDREERDRRKPCRAFVSESADPAARCERCDYHYPEHHRAWRSAT